jgi:hypothetical protein
MTITDNSIFNLKNQLNMKVSSNTILRYFNCVLKETIMESAADQFGKNRAEFCLHERTKCTASKTRTKLLITSARSP